MINTSFLKKKKKKADTSVYLRNWDVLKDVSDVGDGIFSKEAATLSYWF